MSWGNYANNANCSRLLIGVSGDPLGYFNINGSRAGVVFQNYGSKAGANDLDSLMAAASGLVANAGNDMQFTWTYIDNIEDNAVTTGVVIDRNETQYADLKSYTNTTNSQWNAGIAKKDLFLKGLDCGFGLAHYGNSIVYNGGGVKSADNKYLTADGVTAAGMPAGSTQGNSATANYLRHAGHRLELGDGPHLPGQTRYPRQPEPSGHIGRALRDDDQPRRAA